MCSALNIVKQIGYTSRLGRAILAQETASPGRQATRPPGHQATRPPGRQAASIQYPTCSPVVAPRTRASQHSIPNLLSHGRPTAPDANMNWSIRGCLGPGQAFKNFSRLKATPGPMNNLRPRGVNDPKSSIQKLIPFKADPGRMNE